MRAVLLTYLNFCFHRHSISMSSSPYKPPKSLKGIFVGSGVGGLSNVEITKNIINLTSKSPEDVTVLYLGTATYDLISFREKQTKLLKDTGCKITWLDVTSECPTREEMTFKVQSADVILVSGGNTLYAVDRWKKLNLDELLHDAMIRGTVLAGGSAGAICWFQGGHSDSFDPDTYKRAMLKSGTEILSETSSETKQWDYIRVDGLGFLPGLLCPHHDQTQSNGVLRAEDFNDMLLKHSYEIGIGIDHWAALEINENGRYRVISLKDKKGSVLPDKSFCKNREGKPGIWIKHVCDGQVLSRLLPDSGCLEDFLCFPYEISENSFVQICRKENHNYGTLSY